MPETGKKSGKSRISPAKTRKRGQKGARRTGKSKKAASREILQVATLTAAMILAAALISLAIIAAGRETPTREAGAAAAENESPRGKAPAEKPPAEAAAAFPAKPPEAKPAEAKTMPKAAPEAGPEARPAERQPAAARAPPETEVPQKHRGTLAFVIDDAGNNLEELAPFLRFPGPLTISVLPGLPHSEEAARRVRAAGKEAFLHQPMEAEGGQAPGPGAIYSWMDDDEIRGILRKNIAEIGPVTGLNNHQGSKITADRRAMEIILEVCREQNIRFLDSRTTADTEAPEAARRLGMGITERNVFLDNEQDRASISRSIREGLGLASRRGSAVMVGHAWSPALAPLLEEMYQDLIDQGYELATVSDLAGH